MNAALDIVQFDEARKLWQTFARQSDNDRLSFELEIHKKLMTLFQVGECYYYIFNLATAKVEMVSESVKPMLGLNSMEEFTTEYVLSSLHPDDFSTFLQFEQQGGEFISRLPIEKRFKYKVSTDYRLRRMDGQYIRILYQVMPIQLSEDGGLLRSFGVHTNISHLKKDNALSLSMIGMDGEPSYYDIANTKAAPSILLSEFTKQEKKIFDLILDGRNSQQIADYLCISKLTVDTHRRNMLKKAGATSMSELTLKFLRS